MKDYSLSRAFRNDNRIAAENIQWAGGKLGYVSLGPSKVEIWGSRSNQSYTDAVNNTNVNASTSTNWWCYVFEGKSSSYYYHYYNFLWFDTGTLQTQYGITASSIFLVRFWLGTKSIYDFLTSGTTITLNACVETSPRALTQSVLSSGNYANPNNRATFSYQHQPGHIYSLYHIEFTPGAGFKDTFNWTGTTILAFWVTISNPSSDLLFGYYTRGGLEVYFHY